MLFASIVYKSHSEKATNELACLELGSDVVNAATYFTEHFTECLNILICNDICYTSM